jgi:hypothetical protein
MTQHDSKTHFLAGKRVVCGRGLRPQAKPAKRGTTDADQVTCVACRRAGRLGRRKR